jgi:glycine/D-amino acid oxidase-like deaminating enzyme
LQELDVKADLRLPGVWELARGTTSMDGKAVHALKDSPIDWSDSGKLQAVGSVPGGSVDPGKVVTGLARAAEKAGAWIAEHARVEKIEFAEPVRLYVEGMRAGGRGRRVVGAKQVLIATNAGSLELSGELVRGREPAEPKLTFAMATAPFSKKEIAELGLASGRAFYTVDLPYLWGRLIENGGIVWGSGLVPGWGESPVRGTPAQVRQGRGWSGLEAVDIRKGQAAERLRSLEGRVRGLHPVLKKMRVTHRWGGPILITSKFWPVFRQHPKSERVIVSGGYSGHGVALSVYLGERAAQVMAGLATGEWELRP